MILIVILIAYTKVWRYDFKSSKTLLINTNEIHSPIKNTSD
jgi:hypothetical protein